MRQVLGRWLFGLVVGLVGAWLGYGFGFVAGVEQLLPPFERVAAQYEAQAACWRAVAYQRQSPESCR